MERKSNGKIFCFKNKFLNFSESKKFSTENFLTFRELQPIVSYKWVSYKKSTCIAINYTVFMNILQKCLLGSLASLFQFSPLNDIHLNTLHRFYFHWNVAGS